MLRVLARPISETPVLPVRGATSPVSSPRAGTVPTLNTTYSTFTRPNATLVVVDKRVLPADWLNGTLDVGGRDGVMLLSKTPRSVLKKRCVRFYSVERLRRLLG